MSTQEKIEEQWTDGDCYAPFLSQCCKAKDTTNTRGTGGTTTASNNESSNNGGIATGVTVVVLFVIVIVAVCFLHRSCPLHGKMNGSDSKPPLSPNTEEISSTEENEPVTVSGDDNEGATTSNTSTVQQQINSISNVLNATSNVASTVESVTGIINNVAQIASLARGDPLQGTENITVDQYTNNNNV